MNNDVKVAKNYSPAKMRRAVMLMEQFWLLSQQKDIDEKDRKCAAALFKHFQRLAMCILMKEMPEQFVNELVIDVDYMKNMYRQYEN